MNYNFAQRSSWALIPYLPVEAAKAYPCSRDWLLGSSPTVAGRLHCMFSNYLTAILPPIEQRSYPTSALISPDWIDTKFPRRISGCCALRVKANGYKEPSSCYEHQVSANPSIPAAFGQMV